MNLRTKKKEKDNESEEINKRMEEYIKTQTIKKLSYNNNIGAQQKALEDYEGEKAKLSRENEEKTDSRLKKTSEHGQILMTINNMFERVTTRGKDLVAQNPLKDSGPLKDFEDRSALERQAQIQLEVIHEFITNF